MSWLFASGGPSIGASASALLANCLNKDHVFLGQWIVLWEHTSLKSYPKSESLFFEQCIYMFTKAHLLSFCCMSSILLHFCFLWKLYNNFNLNINLNHKIIWIYNHFHYHKRELYGTTRSFSSTLEMFKRLNRTEENKITPTFPLLEYFRALFIQPIAKLGRFCIFSICTF